MKAIAAMDANRGIGYKGRIPWHIPDDFKWFKKFTMNNTLIMGRTTFDDLPPLKNRDIVVLSDSLKTIAARNDYLNKNRHKCRQLFIRDSMDFDVREWFNPILAGGARTYKHLLPLCNEVYMSHVVDEYDCDTYMPVFEDKFTHSEVVSEHKDFWVVKYTR